MSPTTRPDLVDSYATDPGKLVVRAVPGSTASTFTVFDGTVLSVTPSGAGAFDLAIQGGRAFTKGADFELIGFGNKPSKVEQGGAALMELPGRAALGQASAGWTFSSTTAGGELVIRTPASATVHVTR
jgi:hypothetical protein